MSEDECIREFVAALQKHGHLRELERRGFSHPSSIMFVQIRQCLDCPDYWYDIAEEIAATPRDLLI